VRWLLAPIYRFARLLSETHHKWLDAYVAYAIVTVLVAVVLTHQR
jgi:hypothetical protein